MKILEWVNFLNKMKLQNKNIYTLAEIANIDHTTMKSAKTILQRFKKNNILINIYKNIWSLPNTSIYEIAPYLDSSCYCSMETALSYYNLIKQAPQTFHFVSTKYSKKISTKLGIIVFHKIKRDLYFGFNNKIAAPEKAFLDYLYFCFKDGRRPFIDYDQTGLQKIDFVKLKKWAKPFPKKVTKTVNQLSKKIKN